MELEADKWAELWDEHGVAFAPPEGILDSSAPPITPRMLRTASLSFPAGTGLGADNVAPRAYAALPSTAGGLAQHL